MRALPAFPKEKALTFARLAGVAVAEEESATMEIESVMAEAALAVTGDVMEAEELAARKSHRSILLASTIRVIVRSPLVGEGKIISIALQR